VTWPGDDAPLPVVLVLLLLVSLAAVRLLRRKHALTAGSPNPSGATA
jgi:hypothetical protein